MSKVSLKNTMTKSEEIENQQEEPVVMIKTRPKMRNQDQGRRGQTPTSSGSHCPGPKMRNPEECRRGQTPTSLGPEDEEDLWIKSKKLRKNKNMGAISALCLVPNSCI